jgi:hypothetical protein
MLALIQRRIQGIGPIAAALGLQLASTDVVEILV